MICHECGGQDRHVKWCVNYCPDPVFTFTRPRARSTDPATSHAAAQSVTNATDLQRTVLELLKKHGPSTDMELAQRHADDTDEPASPSGLRTRRAELTEAGLVYDTNERRLSPSGRSCVVWACK